MTSPTLTEPRYEGRPLRLWLASLNHEERSTRLRAQEALRRIGTAAVPPLERELRRRNPMHVVVAGFVSRYLPRVGWETVDASVHRQAAVRALGILGPAARHAVPALLDGVIDAQRWLSPGLVEQTLVSIGPDAIPDLVTALSSPVGGVREMASLALLRIVREQRPPVVTLAMSVPTLSRSLNDSQAAVRLRAAQTLALLGDIAASSSTPLLRATMDPEPAVKEAVLAAIAVIRPQTGDAIPRVALALKDPSGRVRAAAAQALARYDARAVGALSQLASALLDPEPAVRIAAANALGRLGEKAFPAVGGLEQNLHHEGRLVRTSSAKALSRIGPAAWSATDGLCACLDSDDPGVRSAAAEALGAIGPRGDRAVGPLMRLLDDENDHVRIAAIQALGGIGRAARPAVPALLSARNNNPSALSRYVAAALASIEPDVAAGPESAGP